MCLYINRDVQLTFLDLVEGPEDQPAQQGQGSNSTELQERSRVLQRESKKIRPKKIRRLDWSLELHCVGNKNYFNNLVRNGKCKLMKVGFKIQ